MPTLKAILGPTNTGKTHYAIERMMGHVTGMIGLPLRLLAREVYDRVVAQKGEQAVALITGEERIIPASARYHVCTVESMPADIEVSFLAVDEIQLAENPDRGHVFTDRLLHARGYEETLLLGAETMRNVLHELDLHAETETRDRFSELKYIGPTKLTKLPKRTAIVAFSSDEVYAIAELLRRQKGGAAVVMGALSPRTRNAQVAMYQSGEVDYIVATDAIGMGLNLDVDRVVFAARSKFDGRRRRALTAAECAQIAGRAGRFTSAGEFGETGDCPRFDEQIWKRIEDHRFEPVDALQWRSTDLDYTSLKALIGSLGRPSGSPVLRQNPHALDEWVLRRMSEDEAIGPDVKGARNVRRLWDLARLPDFRKAGPEGHGRLVLGLAETLKDPDARLTDAGMAHRLEELASTQGSIAKLQARLASIRTWTYVANRSDWLENPLNWQSRTREIEEHLSDALHEALTARFVDRRTTMLLASLNKKERILTDISPNGDVSIEGHIVGRLVGLQFEPVSKDRGLEGKTLRSAAEAALVPILAERLKAITDADGKAFALANDGSITFNDETVARLKTGSDWLSPETELCGAKDAAASAREAARSRISDWLATEMARLLPAHYRMKHGKSLGTLDGLARGLAYRVMESGAAIDLRSDDPSHRLTPEQREALKAIGLRAGRVAAYAPDAQKPAAQSLIAALRSGFDGTPCPLAPVGAGSFALDGTWPDAALHANGYLRFGRRAVRADLAERLGWEISRCRKEAGKNAFAVPIDLASVVSCPGDDFPGVVKSFGLAPAKKDEETGAILLWRYVARTRHGTARKDTRNKPSRGKPSGKRGAPSGRMRAAEARKADPDNPFAALSALLPPEPPKTVKKKRKRRPKSKPVNIFEYVPFK